MSIIGREVSHSNGNIILMEILERIPDKCDSTGPYRYKRIYIPLKTEHILNPILVESGLPSVGNWLGKHYILSDLIELLSSYGKYMNTGNEHLKTKCITVCSNLTIDEKGLFSGLYGAFGSDQERGLFNSISYESDSIMKTSISKITVK